jgi:hypothetical protein
VCRRAATAAGSPPCNSPAPPGIPAYVSASPSLLLEPAQCSVDRNWPLN